LGQYGLSEAANSREPAASLTIKLLPSPSYESKSFGVFGGFLRRSYKVEGI
jgi:hypothetical protein